jgi:hypothetical protein
LFKRVLLLRRNPESRCSGMPLRYYLMSYVVLRKG